MRLRHIPAFALACSALCSPIAYAQSGMAGHDHHNHSAQAAQTVPASPTADMSSATIRRVDDKRRKLLLQHGPIPNLGMSAMTMGFDIAAGVDINGLNAGDSVLFRADRINGNYTVTEIRKQP